MIHYGAVSFGMSNNYMIDPANIKYLEYFVKADPAYGEISLNTQLRYLNNTVLSTVSLKTSHIDQYVIDASVWSRVRISVADFGIVAPTNISRIIIYMNNPPSFKGFLLDEVRWIGDSKCFESNCVNV